MMSRIQISLSPEDHRRARSRAHQLGISLAEYVRRLVADDLGARAQPQRRDALFDLGDSGGSDIAVDKHSLVGEAVDVGSAR